MGVNVFKRVGYKPRCPANAEFRKIGFGGFVANVRIRTVAVFAN